MPTLEIDFPPTLFERLQREAQPADIICTLLSAYFSALDGLGADKRGAVERMLGEGPVMVTVDARQAEVTVPSEFISNPRLTLRIGHRLTPPIPDLVIDDDGIRCTLSFNRQPFHCVLPWDAIYVVNIEGHASGVAWNPPPDSSATPPEPPAPAGRGRLKLVE